MLMEELCVSVQCITALKRPVLNMWEVEEHGMYLK